MLVDSGKYDSIVANEEYTLKTRRGIVDGEMDVYAIRKTPHRNYALLFEVKSSKKGLKKAYQQLNKDEVYFKQKGNFKVYKFTVTPKMLQWYK